MVDKKPATAAGRWEEGRTPRLLELLRPRTGKRERERVLFSRHTVCSGVLGYPYGLQDYLDESEDSTLRACPNIEHQAVRTLQTMSGDSGS